MGGESQPSTIRWHQDRVREMKPQSDFNANRLDSNHKLHYLYSRQLFFPHKNSIQLHQALFISV